MSLGAFFPLPDFAWVKGPAPQHLRGHMPLAWQAGTITSTASADAPDVPTSSPAQHRTVNPLRRALAQEQTRSCGGLEQDRLERRWVFCCRGGWTQAGPGCAVPAPLRGCVPHPAQATRGWGMLVLVVGQAGGIESLSQGLQGAGGLCPLGAGPEGC